MGNFENDDWWKTDARTIATGCPEYMKYSKRSPWIFAVIIIGVVFVFILPFVGIVLLFIGIISLISTIAKGNKCLDTITKEVYANGNVAVWWNESNKVYKNCLKYPPKKRTVSYEASEPIRKGSGNQSKSENIAADVVASYALGKAAQSVIKNAAPVSNVRRNPSTTSERGNQAREQALAGQKARQQGRSQHKERITAGGKTYYITTMPNGNQILTNASGRRVGQYDKTKDITSDGNGKRIGKGNLLQTLV